jgi:hypothetical protein
MWPNERVLTSIENLQSSVYLWDVYCADYQTHNKNHDAIDFLAQKYEISTFEVEKKIANAKGQFRRQHKKVVACKKTGSSSRKPSWWNKSRVQKRFAYFGLSFSPLKIYIPHTFHLQLHSITWRD